MTLEKGNQETKEKRGPPQWRAFHFSNSLFLRYASEGQDSPFPLRHRGARSPPLPVLHQPGKRAVVTPLGGGGEKTGGELVRLPVKGDARTAATPPLARIGAGAFFCITATFHRYSSFIQLDSPKR
jgi:hypothetical protein